jgi:hypothetical protein
MRHPYRRSRLPRLLASTSRPRCSHSRMKSSSNPLLRLWVKKRKSWPSSWTSASPPDNRHAAISTACPGRAISAVLSVDRSPRVHPDKRTSSDPVGTRWCASEAAGVSYREMKPLATRALQSATSAKHWHNSKLDLFLDGIKGSPTFENVMLKLSFDVVAKIPL